MRVYLFLREIEKWNVCVCWIECGVWGWEGADAGAVVEVCMFLESAAK